MAYPQGSTASLTSADSGKRWKLRAAAVSFAAAALVTALVALPAGATFPGTNGRISHRGQGWSGPRWCRDLQRRPKWRRRATADVLA